MPSALVTAEIILAVAVLALGLLIGWTYARRSLIRRGRTVLLCGLRTASSTRWHPGLMSLDGESVQWFPLSAIGTSARYSWDRTELDLGTARRVVEVSDIAGAPANATMLVTARHRSGSLDLALDEPSYTALRSWLESIPPGYNVNVA